MDPLSREEMAHYSCSEKVFFWLKRLACYIYLPLIGILLLVYLCQSIMLNNKMLNLLEQNII